MWKSNHDTQMQNDAAASSSSKAAASAGAAAKAEADRVQLEVTAKRAQRAETVTEVAAAVNTLAEEDVNDELFDGPVLSVTCDPVGFQGHT